MREENLCRAAFLATALHSIILPAQVVVTITVLLLGKVVCRRKSCALLHCEELWDGDAQRLDVDPYVGENLVPCSWRINLHPTRRKPYNMALLVTVV